MRRHLSDATLILRDAINICLFLMAVLGWSWVLSPELHGVMQ